MSPTFFVFSSPWPFKVAARWIKDTTCPIRSQSHGNNVASSLFYLASNYFGAKGVDHKTTYPYIQFLKVCDYCIRSFIYLYFWSKKTHFRFHAKRYFWSSWMFNGGGPRGFFGQKQMWHQPCMQFPFNQHDSPHPDLKLVSLFPPWWFYASDANSSRMFFPIDQVF